MKPATSTAIPAIAKLWFVPVVALGLLLQSGPSHGVAAIDADVKNLLQILKPVFGNLVGATGESMQSGRKAGGACVAASSVSELAATPVT